MNSNKPKEQTDLSDVESQEIENEQLWDNFQIEFLHVAKEFPDNKIYAIIKIIPESARELIKNFKLFVNGYERAEFKSHYQDISISGFDIKNQKKVDIKIQVIPKNNSYSIKESKTCEFFFTGQFISLSPTVSFDWHDNNSNANVIVEWHCINDGSIQKYVVCLDMKEIYYVNQRSFSDQLKICIHNLEPNTNHTIQIMSKLKDRTEEHKSDPIRFTIPEKKSVHNTEVLNVYNERVPLKLRAFIDIKKEEKVSVPKASVPTASVPKDNHFRDRALKLLETLQRQIENRKSY